MKKNIIFQEKNIFTVFFALFLSVFTVNAQQWVNMMSNPKVNLHDVQKAFYAWNAKRLAKEKTNANEKAEMNLWQGDEEKDGNYELFKRWEWYMEPRTYPTGNIPATNLDAQNYLLYKAQQAAQNTDRTQSLPQWTYAGNTSVPVGGGAGRINRICFYPGNDSIIFACSPGGGLWESTNAGSSWTTNTDQLASIATSDLAINPLKPSVMYLSTGDGDGWDQPSIGILKSTDGGITWDTTSLNYALQISGPGYYIGTRVLINPNDTSLILSGMSNGLFISANSGGSWTQTLNVDVKSLEFEPYHPSTVYVATYDGRFFRSADSGYTFTQDTVGLPHSGVGRMTVGVSPADSNRVYVLAEGSATYDFYGLYMSTDRGQTFTPRSLFSSGAPNLLGWSSTGSDSSGQGWYTLALAVSPTNADSLMVGGVNIWQSADSGRTWNIIGEWTGTGAPYVHADIHELTYLPGSGSAYFTACDGGVFTKKTGDSVWRDISSNLAIGEQYSIGLSAYTPGLWITGWQDNGTNLSGNPWKQTLGGDGMVCFIDYTNNANMYGSYQNGSLEYSGNGGINWNNASTNIDESGPWTTRWLQDPQQSNILYAGFKNIWVTGTNGGYWDSISNWGSGSITAIAIAPSNDQYIYAASSSVIHRSFDGGATWTNISSGLPVGAASITGIAVDPNDPKRVWVTFSGWMSAFKVYRSDNGGNTWPHNLSSGLPNLPVNCIIAQEGIPDGIYVGTDIGVYYTDTITNTWMDYSNGLPDVTVDDLKIYTPSNTLVAATYGRGTWKVPTYYLTGVEDLSLNNNIKVYPNPTRDKVNVLFDMPPGNYTINVSNVLGQQVYTSGKVHIPGHFVYTLNLSAYSKGMYFISISNGTKETVKKVMVD